MNNQKVFFVTVILGVIAFLPLIALLAINIVFSLEIAYSFTNWFWMLVLLLMFGNRGTGNKA